ncbi:YifB family Mg chelatase-like AAA ATPase [bacterium]|nr:YifB family Mg chelatase-like AAA ATPase [bacterium]
MVSKILSAALVGLSSQIIEVEVSATKGLRTFSIVGLPDKAIEESKERVSAAINNINLKPPHHQALKVLVNLAPADLKKIGTFYDLPIALGYLLASEQTQFNPQGKLIIGELSLDGTLRPIRGSLPFALLAQREKLNEIILPKENAAEAAIVNLDKNSKHKIKVVGVKNLKETLRYLEHRENIEGFQLDDNWATKYSPNFEVELGWIKGQEHAKRALEISAAGAHNLFMQGPPGAGKTLLAKSIISILPKLSFEESLELTKIYSISGLLPKNTPFLRKRPFRAPHHTSSEASLIGGGNPPRPGEITLSHRGVLFLDEFPEFHRDVLESLRQPVEEGKITISRARYSFTFPARFTLIAAANPSPSGYDDLGGYSASPAQVAMYKRKLSGPLMDRIDIFCNVPAVKYQQLISPEKNEQTKKTREKIKIARDIQQERFSRDYKEGNSKRKILCNSEMNIPQVEKYCKLTGKSQNLLKKYVDAKKLSARGYHRVLKLARTIADLDQREEISFQDVGEALMYRLRDEELAF